MSDFKKMKRNDLEHYLFISNQFYHTMTDDKKLEVDSANAELERRTAKKGSKASPAELKVLDAIKITYNGDISADQANHQFNKGVLRKLLEKGLLIAKSHSRLREDDQELVYWSTYEIAPTKLAQVL